MAKFLAIHRVSGMLLQLERHERVLRAGSLFRESTKRIRRIKGVSPTTLLLLMAMMVSSQGSEGGIACLISQQETQVDSVDALTPWPESPITSFPPLYCWWIEGVDLMVRASGCEVIALLESIMSGKIRVCISHKYPNNSRPNSSVHGDFEVLFSDHVHHD